MISYLRRKRVPTRDTDLGPPNRRWRFIPALAVGVTLLVGGVLPASGFAATIQGVKFIDANGNGGERETIGGQLEPIYQGGGFIYLKSVSAPARQRPLVASTNFNTGEYSFSSNTIIPGDYKIWQYVSPTSPVYADMSGANYYASWLNAHTFTVTPESDVISFDFPVATLAQEDEDYITGAQGRAEDICSATTGGNVVTISTGTESQPAEFPSGLAANTILVINEGVFVDVPDDYYGVGITNQVRPVHVQAVCNRGTLLDADNDGLSIEYDDLFANFDTGKIESVNVKLERYYDEHTQSYKNCDINTAYGQAYGNCDYFALFYNGGIVKGRDGSDKEHTDTRSISSASNPSDYAGENGGEVKIDAMNIVQNGNIQGGDGGNVTFGSSYYGQSGQNMKVGGDGGNVFIQSDSKYLGHASSVTMAGYGGDVTVNNPCVDNPGHCSGYELRGGDSGALTVNSQDVIAAGTYKGSSVYIDPSISLMGSDTKIIAEEDVVIFGFENWELNLSGLSEGAITAGGNITLAVGKGGKIDLQGVSPKAFKAADKVEIHADNDAILLDEGVQLEEIFEAEEEVVVGPSKIIYHVVLSGQQQANGQPNTTVPISLTVSNGGPEKDTYTLSAVSESGWNVSGLPSSVSIEGLKQEQLALSIALPAEGNDTITITATSQADPTVVATRQARATVDLPPKVALTITQSTNGNISAEGIDCGEDCTEDYEVNSEVALTATPNEGYNFNDWQGDCAGTTAELTVTLDKAKSCTATFAEIPNVPPTAALAITPETGEAPLTVALDASASSDTDGTIASYAWTASDGQAANGQNAEFVFSEAGDYTITLEVTDNDGATNSATKTVKVEVAANYAASGTIRDELGNPVAGVTVQIGDKTIVTDDAGNWKITGLQEGDYQVIASKDGYTFPVKPCAVGNNEDCTVKLKPGSVLDIKVVPNSWKPAQGENVTYTITVTNQGEETATGVVLTDTLPEGTNLVSIEALDGGSCDADTVTCSLPDLTPGATATAKIVISNTQAKRLANHAIVMANEYPEDMQTIWTTVKPYLSVTLSDTPDPISTGAVLHYTAEVELSHNAPTTTATGVKLVLHLPSGVELKSVNTDYAMCDTSSLPTLTCSFIDLSIDSADSVNQVTVNVDVALKDAGLLLLTHEAKVTANEYPSHTDRERTKIVIPEGIEVDIAFVIDVTGSMQEEINGVIKALEASIAEIDPSDAPLIALVVFTDDVKIKAFTRDLDVLLGAVEKLKAAGGGTCPEASVEALLIAVPHTKEGGNILFATDASPYPEADVEKVMALLSGKGIRFNAMITGDCSQDSDQNEWLGKE